MPVEIELKKVCFMSDKFPLLREISFIVRKGEVLVISGRSGHGKSTILELCAGLKNPTSGNVLWDGHDLAEFSRKQLLKERQSIGYMFQVHALISNYSVFENIALPLRARSEFSEKQINRRVRNMMDELNLFSIDSLFPEALSIGQLKTVALARALINDPNVLLLDEPLSGVDPSTAQGMMNVLYEKNRSRPMCVIMVSHNTNVWDGFSPVKRVLESGRFTDQALDMPVIKRQYGENIEVFR